ncbi:MAG: hypothetical protein KF832_02010 [Caldilineaceae bacterium]|nr:hypothetical protein [Caldilineaceae bacterium]
MLAAKRALTLCEFALGLAALARCMCGELLGCVHEWVFGMLAWESEPAAPRLQGRKVRISIHVGSVVVLPSFTDELSVRPKQGIASDLSSSTKG